MSSIRKLDVRALEIPVEDDTGRRVGQVRRLDLELAADPTTGVLSFRLHRVELEPPSAAEQQASLIPGTAESAYDPIADVWKEYVDVMQPRSKSLGPQERAVIREAIKVATVSECKGAIRGCRASRFHMGENDRRKKYNSLSQILKGKQGKRTTREQIDFFLDLLAKSGGQSPVASGDPARLRREKQHVRDAAEFPGDEHVVERGREAKAWLEEQGWKVESEGLNVTFTEPPTPPATA